MPFLRSLAAAALMVASIGRAAAAPPVNDTIDGAVSLRAAEYGIFGTLAEATADTGWTTAIGANPFLVWYRVTMPVDGAAIFDTAGSKANALGIVVVPDPMAGAPLADAAPQTLPGTGSHTVTVARVAATRGTKLVIGVGAASVPTQDRTFRLNLHFLPTAAGNELVASPSVPFTLALAQIDGAFVAFTDFPLLINGAAAASPVAFKSPFRTSELTLAADPTSIPSAGAAVVDAQAVGHGPFFGRVGAFRRSATALLGAGPVIGRRPLPIMVMRATNVMPDDTTTPKANLNHRSEVGPLGEPYSLKLTVTNRSGSVLKGCIVYNLVLSAAGENQSALGQNADSGFQAFDSQTLKPLAARNAPVNFKPKQTITFILDGRVSALGLSVGYRSVFCAEPTSVLRSNALAAFVVYGYPKPIKDAYVASRRPADDKLVLSPTDPSDVVFSVRNAGGQRRLTILPSLNLIGYDGPFQTGTVLQQICRANAQGACVGPYTASINTPFKPNQMQRFRVRYRSHGPAGVYFAFVYALDHGDPVGAAAISVEVPSVP